MISRRFATAISLISLTLFLPLAPSYAAVSVDKLEYRNSTLRIEGDGAVSGSTVTARSSDSQASDQADDRGKWRIQADNFQASDCSVTISDGTVGVTRTLSGCTPVTAPPPPPPPPAPVNQAPTANAGTDQTVVDTDGDGFAVVSLSGAASSDADGSIIDYSWSDQSATGTLLGSGSTLSVTRAIGTYAIALTVTDNAGATSTDVVNITVAAAPPPPPAPVNQAPTANAGPDQTVVDTDGDGFAVVTLSGAASSDADGSIIDYSWSEQSATGTLLGSGSTLSVTRAIGTHPIALTVTDNAGATSTDAVNITVAAAPPPPQGGTLGVLESNQAWAGSFDSALMGASVASAGDVNGDGFDDVIVGALGFDAPGGLFDEGAVFVFLGGPEGVIGNSPATAHAAIIGNAAASEFGTSVSGAGDVNGDGFDDIIVGAPLVESSGLIVSGAAYIFLGGPSGITATSPADADFVLESQQIQAWFGFDVAGAGDVNGDGFDDVIVGSPRYGQPFNPPIPNQGSGEQGAAFVFLGSVSGIVGNNPQTAHAMIVPVSAGAPSQTRAFFGAAVNTAGDINADGYNDIIIGAPNWNLDRPWPGLDTGESPGEGTAFIYLGGPSGITGTNPTNAATRIDGDLLNASMGISVAGVGDVNADGFDDVLIGAAGYPAGNPLLVTKEGAAFLYYGGASGINANSATQAQWSAQGTITGEHLGRVVAAAGDVNGDGIADVVISARTFAGAIADDTVFNGSPRLSGEGIVYVYNGSPAGLVDTAITVRSGQESGSAGYSVGGPADVNGDGLNDLIVGVPGYTGDQAREGAAIVHLSNGTSPILPSANATP